MYSLKVPVSSYLFNGKNYKHACTTSYWSVLLWGSTLLGPILCSRFKQNVINTWYIIHILSTCFSKQQKHVSQTTYLERRKNPQHERTHGNDETIYDTKPTTERTKLLGTEKKAIFTTPGAEFAWKGENKASCMYAIEQRELKPKRE